MPSSDGPFRSPRHAPHDIVAIGNDLALPVLLDAYRKGIFPWPVDEENPICWFSPRRRAILEHSRLHIGRTLRRALRKPWTVTIDQSFAEVIRACAEPRGEGDDLGTWIVHDMIEAYERLHAAGRAHSVEVWFDGRLVGGLYGVDPGGVFVGESMFTRTSEASKVALVHLMEHLHQRGLDWIDIQMLTPHLQRMGARLISRSDYLDRLEEALGRGLDLF